jgi:hypothetical protein
MDLFTHYRTIRQKHIQDSIANIKEHVSLITKELSDNDYLALVTELACEFHEQMMLAGAEAENSSK